MLLEVSFTSEMGDFLGSKALSFHQDRKKILLIQLGERLSAPDNTIDDSGRGPVSGAFRVDDIVVRDRWLTSMPFNSSMEISLGR